MQNHGNYVALALRDRALAGREGRGAGRQHVHRLSRRTRCWCEDDRVIGVRTTPERPQARRHARQRLHPAHRPDRARHRARGGHARPAHAGLAAVAGRGLRQPADLRAGREGAVGDEAAARRRRPHDGLAAADRRVRRQLPATRWSPTWSRSAWWSGSTTSDATLDVHVLLQRMKQHPLFRPYLEGGEMVEWGAKTIPEGGYYSLPAPPLTATALLVVGDAAGFVDVASLKGIHYAMQSGMLRRARDLRRAEEGRHHRRRAGGLRPRRWTAASSCATCASGATCAWPSSPASTWAASRRR